MPVGALWWINSQMISREDQITRFLEESGLAHAQRTNLAGDASNRRYFRLNTPGGETLVLMDAPPSKGEDVRPFVRIAEYLRKIGLSAPKIIAQKPADGLLVLEDLGDDLFARIVKEDRKCEPTLYTAAIDLLAELHRYPPPEDLAEYNTTLAADLSGLAFDWYALGITGSDNTKARDAVTSELTRLILTHAPECDVLVQRDYHSENLLWLPDRRAHRRVGLLDFQDALKGNRAYDLVSLLQDARRDVPNTIEADMLHHYIATAQQNEERFKLAYAIWGAQRNLRIIGVFARLCLRDGKPGYLGYIPRVWNLLLRDLAHPKLTRLEKLVIETIPEPAPANIKKLETKCARVRTQ